MIPERLAKYILFPVVCVFAAVRFGVRYPLEAGVAVLAFSASVVAGYFAGNFLSRVLDVVLKCLLNP